jgi:hypothetical protein
MNEQQSSNGGQAPAASSPPAPRPAQPSRTALAFYGGMLAGIAIAIALAIVMHVIQRLSPGNPPCSGYGCDNGIGGDVFLVLLLGPVIGLGLGIGFGAAVPESTPDAAASAHQAP